MLYTRKGDTGTTKTFGCDQRISKSSSITEALGSLDEINSFLGLLKVKSGDERIGQIQQDLFIIQAELAGADKTITEEKVKWQENIIDTIEKSLPPITTFFVSGGTELASLTDIARTIARRAERRVVGVVDEYKTTPPNGTPPSQGGEDRRIIGAHSLAYLNRLSSVLYAYARDFNHQAGIVEEPPKYE